MPLPIVPKPIFPLSTVGGFRFDGLPDGSEVLFDNAGCAYIGLPSPVKKIKAPAVFLFPPVLREPCFQRLCAADGEGRATTLEGGERPASNVSPAKGSQWVEKKRVNFEEMAKASQELIVRFWRKKQEPSVENSLKFAKAFRFFGDLRRSKDILAKTLSRPWLKAKERGKVLYNLAVTLREQGRLDEALQRIDEALSLRPDSTSCLCEKGIILRAKRNFTDSISCLNDIIQRDSQNPWYYCEMAVTYEVVHYCQLALRNIDYAIQLNPSHPRHYCEKAVLFREMGKLPEALEQVDKAIELDPTYPRHYREKAEILKLMGRAREAKTAAAKAARLENRWKKIKP